MQQTLDCNYWDMVADRLTSPIFEKNVGLYYKDEHISLIKKWSEGLPGKRILKTDLFEEAFSCGDFLPWLSAQNAIVFGMDISSKIVRKACDNIGVYGSAHGKNFIVSDVSSCAFKNESFDLVISNSTIDNLSSEDAILALKEFRRILRPSGTLILTLDNRNNPLYFLGYLAEKVLKTNKYYQGRCYSVKEAMLLAKGNNFKVEEITSIVHIPTPFNKIALSLSKVQLKCFERFIVRCINIFSKLLDNKRIGFLSGWFIALKLTKNE